MSAERPVSDVHVGSRNLTGYENHDANSGVPDEEVFLYDAAAGRLEVRVVRSHRSATGGTARGW